MITAPVSISQSFTVKQIAKITNAIAKISNRTVLKVLIYPATFLVVGSVLFCIEPSPSYKQATTVFQLFYVTNYSRTIEVC